MVYKRVGEPFHHAVGKRPEFFPWQVYRFDEFVEHHFADIPPHVRILTGLTHDVYAGKICHGESSVCGPFSKVTFLRW